MTSALEATRRHGGLDPVVVVPVDLDGEERLAGPVTFRMAGWLAVAGAGGAAIGFGHPGLLRVAVGILLLVVGLAGAFVRPAGIGLLGWLVPMLGYWRRTRTRTPIESAALVPQAVEPARG